MPFDHDVFMSYRHADLAVAERLEAGLKERGLKVWRDQRLNEDAAALALDMRILNALDSSARVLVLWSLKAIESDWVRGEATRAKEAGRYLGLTIEPLVLPPPFNVMHALDLAAIEKDFTLLMRALGAETADLDNPALQSSRSRLYRPLFDPEPDVSKLPEVYTPILYGREAEMRRLFEAWDSASVRVFALDAMGGAGKTALVWHFVQALKESRWRGARRVFAWSFYSQGSNEDRQTHADEFFAAAFAYFSPGATPPKDPRDKGVELAKLVRKQRSLLILDGMEPLQYAAGKAGGGRDDRGVIGGIKDPGVKALLKALAESNPGLVIVTTRLKLSELDGNAGFDRAEVSRLDTRSAIQLMLDLGAEPQWKDHALPARLRPGESSDRPVMPDLVADALEAAVEELEGHALAVTLAAKWLAEHFGSDIRAMAELPALSEIDTGEPTRSPYRAIRAHEIALARRIAEQGKTNAPIETSAGQQLALLFFLGFFDRDADADLFSVVFAKDGQLAPERDDEAAPEPASLPPGVKEKDLPAAEQAARAALRERKRRVLVRRLFQRAGGLSVHQLRAALAQLAAQGLASKADETVPWEHARIDCHPLVREYFGARLKELDPPVYRAAHARLYDHYRYAGLPPAFREPVAYGLLADQCAFPDYGAQRTVDDIISGRISRAAMANTPKALVEAPPAQLRAAAELIGGREWDVALEAFLPDDEKGMEPLFSAIRHGCAAEQEEESFKEVYWPRIARGSMAYAARKLGLFGQELAALAAFFEGPGFSTPSARLSPTLAALTFNQVGYRLRALGRLEDAVAPLREAPRRRVALNDDEMAASGYNTLSELLLTLGEISGPDGAAAAAEAAARHAERCSDHLQRLVADRQRGAAAMAEGRIDEAERLFAGAEALRKERQPEFPRLYSYGGYHLTDLLLARGRAREARARYLWQVSVRQEADPLLDFALEELAAARIALALGDLSKGLAPADAALKALHRANNIDDLPHGILTRAETALALSLADEAVESLNEAEAIAARGPMPLFATEACILRARLALRQGNREFALKKRAEAVALIEKHRYERRRPDIAVLDAEMNPANIPSAISAVAQGWWWLIARLEALGADASALRDAEAAYNRERDEYLATTIARMPGYDPASDPITAYLGVAPPPPEPGEAPEMPDVPDGLLDQILRDPKACAAIERLLQASGVDTPLAQMPREAQRAAVAAVMAAAEQAARDDPAGAGGDYGSEPEEEGATLRVDLEALGLPQQRFEQIFEQAARESGGDPAALREALVRRLRLSGAAEEEIIRLVAQIPGGGAHPEPDLPKPRSWWPFGRKGDRLN